MIKRSLVLAALAAFLASPGALADHTYDRSEWGRWERVEETGENGCRWDSRHLLLRNVGRETNPDTLTTREESGSSCRVVTLTVIDRYTGERHTGPANKIDIDHIVPIAEAWRSGGADWSREKKSDFYNDPLNHLPAHERTNARKSDIDPGGQSLRGRRATGWWPPDTSQWCWYAQRWIEVKLKWGLTFDPHEVFALVTTAGHCWEQPEETRAPVTEDCRVAVADMDPRRRPSHSGRPPHSLTFRASHDRAYQGRGLVAVEADLAVELVNPPVPRQRLHLPEAGKGSTPVEPGRGHPGRGLSPVGEMRGPRAQPGDGAVSDDFLKRARADLDRISAEAWREVYADELLSRVEAVDPDLRRAEYAAKVLKLARGASETIHHALTVFESATGYSAGDKRKLKPTQLRWSASKALYLAVRSSLAGFLAKARPFLGEIADRRSTVKPSPLAAIQALIQESKVRDPAVDVKLEELEDSMWGVRWRLLEALKHPVAEEVEREQLPVIVEKIGACGSERKGSICWLYEGHPGRCQRAARGKAGS